MEVVKNIGKRVKLLRKSLNMSQLELAFKCDISQASIARIESGLQNNLTIVTIGKLAKGLHEPVSRLLQDPIKIKDNKTVYRPPITVPVILAEELETIEHHKNIFMLVKNSERIEPTFAKVTNAFYLVAGGGIISKPIIDSGDHLLFEPVDDCEEGDVMLLLSSTHCVLGKIYHRPGLIVVQPMDSAKPPFFINIKSRKKVEVFIFKLKEIKKK